LSAPESLRRQRLTLIGLALLFLAPLLLAFYAYYGLHWHPGKRVNHGELIEPPRPLPELSMPRVSTADGKASSDSVDSTDLFKGKWTLLYVGAGTCPAACRAALFNTRQVRSLLREDDRVQRVFIAEGECCDLEFLRAQHADLVTVRGAESAAPLLAVLTPGTSASDPAAAGRIYLIDPLGNLMMQYAPSLPPKGMLEDLKRLLGLSHIG
jgi:cytochrome oxidase Cu insertion factor (SCO1/SenC/PrrC family)